MKMIVHHRIKKNLLCGNTNIILSLLMTTPFTVLYPIKGDDETIVSLNKTELKDALSMLGEKMFEEGDFTQKEIRLWFGEINNRFFFLPIFLPNTQGCVNFELEEDEEVILFNPMTKDKDSNFLNIILAMHGEYISNQLGKPVHIVSMFEDFPEIIVTNQRRDFIYCEQNRVFVPGERNHILIEEETTNPISKRIIEILEVIGTMDIYILLKRIVSSQIGVYLRPEKPI